MKKILVTRKLIKDSEDKALKIFDAKLNSNDELYSQSRVIEMSQGCDGVLTSLTDKMDKDTINKLPDTIKIISNFAVGFGNIDLEAAKKRGIAVTNTPEVLSDATAEIGVLLINLSSKKFLIEDGERIAQLVLASHNQASWEPVESLEASDRGTDGFGSTGIQ